MGLTYQHLPFAVGLGHLISTAHLVQAHTPEDENNEARATAVLPRGLILVPVPVAGAEEREKESDVYLHLENLILYNAVAVHAMLYGWTQHRPDTCMGRLN